MSTRPASRSPSWLQRQVYTEDIDTGTQRITVKGGIILTAIALFFFSCSMSFFNWAVCCIHPASSSNTDANNPLDYYRRRWYMAVQIPERMDRKFYPRGALESQVLDPGSSRHSACQASGIRRLRRYRGRSQSTMPFNCNG
jgi:hypothetical protein